MDTQSDRLQDARRRAGFRSASDAARAHGWNENTYRSHENGERGLRSPVAIKYSRAFRVDSGWLLTGSNRLGTDIDPNIKQPLQYITPAGVECRIQGRGKEYVGYSSARITVRHSTYQVLAAIPNISLQVNDLVITDITSLDKEINIGDILVVSLMDDRKFVATASIFRHEKILQAVDGNMYGVNEVKFVETLIGIVKPGYYDIVEEGSGLR